MVNVIKAAANIRVEHPLTTILSIRRRMDGLNRIHRAAPWPKAVELASKRASHSGSRAALTIACITRSLPVGMPKGLCCPLSLGM